MKMKIPLAKLDGQMTCLTMISDIRQVHTTHIRMNGRRISVGILIIHTTRHSCPVTEIFTRILLVQSSGKSELLSRRVPLPWPASLRLCHPPLRSHCHHLFLLVHWLSLQQPLSHRRHLLLLVCRLSLQQPLSQCAAASVGVGTSTTTTSTTPGESCTLISHETIFMYSYTHTKNTCNVLSRAWCLISQARLHLSKACYYGTVLNSYTLLCAAIHLWYYS